MLTLLLVIFTVYVLLCVTTEIFASKEIRPWAILSLTFLLYYAHYQNGGMDTIVGAVPLSILLLWFLYMNIKK